MSLTDERPESTEIVLVKKIFKNKISSILDKNTIQSIFEQLSGFEPKLDLGLIIDHKLPLVKYSKDTTLHKMVNSPSKSETRSHGIVGV